MRSDSKGECMRFWMPCVVVGVLLAAVGTAGASAYPVFPGEQTGPGAVFTYSGQWDDPQGDNLERAAEVIFAADAYRNLTITVTNTFAGDVWYHSELLTAVFFDTATPLDLTPVSALVAPGSAVLFSEAAQPSEPHPPLPADQVGGEFAFRAGLPWWAPGGASYGISSVGIDLFGPQDLFPPQVDLDGPLSPDGMNYGITAAGDDRTTGSNPDVTGTEPIIQNSVIFTLSGLPADFDPSTEITNVWFLYGTSWVIPEPVTLATLGAGMCVVAIRWHRKRR